MNTKGADSQHPSILLSSFSFSKKQHTASYHNCHNHDADENPYRHQMISRSGRMIIILTAGFLRYRRTRRLTWADGLTWFCRVTGTRRIAWIRWVTWTCRVAWSGRIAWVSRITWIYRIAGTRRIAWARRIAWVGRITWIYRIAGITGIARITWASRIRVCASGAFDDVQSRHRHIHQILIKSDIKTGCRRLIVASCLTGNLNTVLNIMHQRIEAIIRQIHSRIDADIAVRSSPCHFLSPIAEDIRLETWISLGSIDGKGICHFQKFYFLLIFPIPLGNIRR